jgi:hypothetical protein
VLGVELAATLIDASAKGSRLRTDPTCTPEVCEHPPLPKCVGSRILTFVNPRCEVVPPQAYAICRWDDSWEDCGRGTCDPAALRCVYPCPPGKSGPDECAEDGLGVVSHVLAANGPAAESCVPATATTPCQAGWCDPATATCGPLPSAFAELAKDLRVSFRTWDGDWHAAIPNKVQIRSLTVGPRPVPTAGDVVSDRGEVAAKFRTTMQGEAWLDFVPKAGATYRVVVKEPVELDLAETKVTIPAAP